MGIPLKLDPDKRSHELYDDLDYKEFWTGWQQRKLDQAERMVVQRLLPPAGRRLIDLGCGYGRLLPCYLDRFEQVVLFDGSLAFLQEARQKAGGRAIYIAGDVNQLPFRRGSFDGILMVRVLHHIADSKRCMSELHRILAAGGRLVFTYRNKLYLMNILRWLARG
jgi:ubiquinone/menaquinone biosynthesis C-methylase UbiE